MDSIIKKYNIIYHNHINAINNARKYIENNNILSLNQDIIEEEAHEYYNKGYLYLALTLYNYAIYANLMISKYTKAAYYQNLHNQCRREIMIKLIGLMQQNDLNLIQ